MKALVIGDLHHRGDEPKCYQVPKFFTWLLKQDYFKEHKYIILAGDLVESVFIEHGFLSYFVDLFLNELNDKIIYIVEGNHDKTLDTNIIDIFRPFKNVIVIDSAKAEQLENTSFLFLPHYDHEGTDLEPMEIAYPKLKIDTEIDFGIAHITDHTQPGNKKVDTSKLSVKQWLNGHIHTPDIQKGGNYLGSPVLNSLTESGKTPLIASIDLMTKKFSLIEVPKFLEYFCVTYPDPLPEKIGVEFGIFTIKESLDKQETVKYYENQAKDKPYKFYIRRIESKKTLVQVEKSNGKSENGKSPKEYLDSFISSQKVKDKIADILKEAICG